MRGDPRARARTRSSASTRRARRPSRASAPRARRYKVELAERLPEGEEVTFYEQDGFVDLCRGPHLQTTEADQGLQADLAGGRLLARRLRQPDADAHLRHGVLRPGRARRPPRAHRGGAAARPPPPRPRARPLPLSATSRPARRSGTRAGMVLFNELARLWRELNASRGYQEVRTPILYDTELWKRSGHWDNYRDKMFLTEQVEGRQFGLKPMNCPGHVEIYNQRAPLLPRPAAAARRAGPRAPQRGLGRRCTACCACATSRRTTPTSSAAGTRSRTRSSAASSSRA